MTFLAGTFFAFGAVFFGDPPFTTVLVAVASVVVVVAVVAVVVVAVVVDAVSAFADAMPENMNITAAAHSARFLILPFLLF